MSREFLPATEFPPLSDLGEDTSLDRSIGYRSVQDLMSSIELVYRSMFLVGSQGQKGGKTLMIHPHPACILILIVAPLQLKQ